MDLVWQRAIFGAGASILIYVYRVIGDDDDFVCVYICVGRRVCRRRRFCRKSEEAVHSSVRVWTFSLLFNWMYHTCGCRFSTELRLGRLLIVYSQLDDYFV